MGIIIDTIVLILFVLFMFFIFGGYHKKKFLEREPSEDDKIDKDSNDDKFK